MATETNTTYNGYANYETWCVSLWIDNDQSEQEFWLGMAKDFVQDVADGQREADNITYDLAERIKDWLGEQVAEALPNASMLTDLLTSAIQTANTHEIAENLIEQAQEASS